MDGYHRRVKDEWSRAQKREQESCEEVLAELINRGETNKRRMETRRIV